jgi:hypothetical protein
MLAVVRIIVLVLLSNAAHAADRVPTKISIEQAIDLVGALAALDGADHVIKDGQQERIVREPYKLGAGLRLVIAKDMVKLKDIVASFDKARASTIMEMTGGRGNAEKGSQAEAKLGMALREMLAVEQEVDLIHFKASELNLDGNAIPGTVLSQLTPILDE